MTTHHCDQCGKDITRCQSGFDVYKFLLVPDLVHNTAEIRYGMSVPSPPSGEFCSLTCLKSFLGDMADEWAAR